LRAGGVLTCVAAGKPMKQFYHWVALSYFVVATISLMLLAILLLVNGLYDVMTSLRTAQRIDVTLDSIGLLIIGFAVIETAKFIAEEEVLRQRELRSPKESRRSITKFITIIVIAASLEALVMIFKTSLTSIPDAIYPAGLFIAAMFALVALGAYQYLSSRIDPSVPEDQPEG
jgi:hypothetical protein